SSDRRVWKSARRFPGPPSARLESRRLVRRRESAVDLPWRAPAQGLVRAVLVEPCGVVTELAAHRAQAKRHEDPAGALGLHRADARCCRTPPPLRVGARASACTSAGTPRWRATRQDRAKATRSSVAAHTARSSPPS